MYKMTISDKRGNEFEKEKGGIWGMEKDRGNYIIIFSKLKENFSSLEVHI